MAPRQTRGDLRASPARYTNLQVLAAAEGKTVGRFVRETIVESLDLEDQARRLYLLLAGVEREEIPLQPFAALKQDPKGFENL